MQDLLDSYPNGPQTFVNARVNAYPALTPVLRRSLILSLDLRDFWLCLS